MKPDCLKKDMSIFKGTSKQIQICFILHCELYQMEENDSLILQVIDYRNDDNIVIEKVLYGDNCFNFVPSDTRDLDVGFYRWNVKFKPQNSQEIYEIISPSIFHIKAGE